jgi:hypothetical protein
MNTPPPSRLRSRDGEPRRLPTRLPTHLCLATLASWGLLLAGCGQPPADTTALFPLQPGHAWTYRTLTEEENLPPERDRLVLRTLGRETLEGAPGLEAGPAWRRRSDSGVDYWLRSDASGIYRVASKTDLEAEPRPDGLSAEGQAGSSPRRYVLKAPYTVGTQWQATTTSYLLKRRQDFPREVRHTHPSVVMNYVIEATGEKLSTAAGDFDDCLRVRGLASLRLFADPVAGWRDMPLTTVEWYCRGVGLVRLQRDEPAGSAFLSGGTYTMELIEWQ